MSYTTDGMTVERVRRMLDEYEYHPPVVDTARLRKTFDWVTEQHELNEQGKPSEWNQNLWMTGIRWAMYSDKGLTIAKVEQRLDIDCGSACCVFGKVAYDAGAVFVTDTMVWMPGEEFASNIQEKVPELLGITESEGAMLSNGDNDYDDVKVIVEAILMRAGERL